jgi:hypothetical protein
MRIVVFTSDEAPAGGQALAKILMDNGSYVPAAFLGPSPAAVRSLASTWWAKEVERVGRRSRKAFSDVDIADRISTVHQASVPAPAVEDDDDDDLIG